MTTKTRVSLLSLLVATALPALADQDEFFWKQRQLTDGTQAHETTPLPAVVSTGGAKERSIASDWFALERQKTDGYVAEQVAVASARTSRDRDMASAGKR